MLLPTIMLGTVVGDAQEPLFSYPIPPVILVLPLLDRLSSGRISQCQ